MFHVTFVPLTVLHIGMWEICIRQEQKFASWNWIMILPPSPTRKNTPSKSRRQKMIFTFTMFSSSFPQVLPWMESTCVILWVLRWPSMTLRLVKVSIKRYSVLDYLMSFFWYFFLCVHGLDVGSLVWYLFSYLHQLMTDCLVIMKNNEVLIIVKSELLWYITCYEIFIWVQAFSDMPWVKNTLTVILLSFFIKSYLLY